MYHNVLKILFQCPRENSVGLYILKIKIKQKIIHHKCDTYKYGQ